MTRKLIPFEVPQVTHGLPAQIWIENDVERQSPQEIIIVSLTARIAALEADNAQLREVMEKIGDIAESAQGDWYPVSSAQAPEVVQEYKEIESIVDEALAGAR